MLKNNTINYHFIQVQDIIFPITSFSIYLISLCLASAGFTGFFLFHLAWRIRPDRSTSITYDGAPSSGHHPWDVVQASYNIFGAIKVSLPSLAKLNKYDVNVYFLVTKFMWIFKKFIQIIFIVFCLFWYICFFIFIYIMSLSLFFCCFCYSQFDHHLLIWIELTKF